MAGSKLSTDDEPLKEETEVSIEDAEEVTDQEVTEQVETQEAEDVSDAPVDEVTEPEAETTPTPEPAAVQEEAKSTFFPALMGGVLAAGVGFGAASYIGFGSGNENAILIAAQSDQLDTQADRITALEASISMQATALEDATTQSTTDQTRQDDALTATQENLASLVARLDAIEASALEGDGISEATMGALRDDIAGVSASLADQVGRIDDIVAADSVEATQTADMLASLAAVSQIRAALAGGENYASAVDELDRLGVAVPDSLRASVDGVVSQAALAEGFSAPAREALGLALQQSAGDDVASRVTVFLRRQTGLRSLTPSEGNDPDAVLSRAEAALSAADYATTVEELALLPEVAQDVFADWLSELHTRTAALRGVETLSQTLSGN